MIGIDILMPKSCKECPCLRYGEYGAFEKSWCALPQKIRGVIWSDRRPNDCPLIELEEGEKINELRTYEQG